jgi:hypothetical protein
MKGHIPRILFTMLLSAHFVCAAQVNFVQDAVDDSTGTPIGAVSSNQWLETSSTYSTASAPSLWNGYRFTHWTNSSYPAATYRDAWGRSLNPISFVLLEDTTATAQYLPDTSDTDGDSVPDWYEIEYFGNLNQGATSNSDGDGLTLLEEYQSGTHPLYGNSEQAGGVAYADTGLITFNRNGYPTYTLRSEPAGTVNESAVVPPGTVITTPNLTQSTFGYWTLDGVPQRDAWGVAVRQISFTMDIQNREAVAWFFDGDSDGDGLVDAWEWYYLGGLANDDSDDLNADGLTLLQDYQAGRAPTFGYAFQAGGVAWADSEIVTVNLAGFSRYTLASDPPGTVDQSAIVPDGTQITTPNMTQPAFGFWTLDGVQQRDAWGVALRQLTFTVDGTDRTAVAHLFSNDSDGDGVNDGFEQYHFGTLANDAASDTDGDGIALLSEFTVGSNPVFGNAHQPGGVSWADSSILVVNLQPYERLGKLLIGGVLTDFFSPDPNSVTGIDAGTWSATAVTDWDDDGDFDLFIAHEGGLRVFRNIGTGNNPNFEEVSSGFTALSAYIAGIDRPMIAGGDWNGDGLGDLIIGGNTGTLRLVTSSGAFSSNANGLDLTLPSTRTSPALADVNGDSRADLLVLLDDGTITVFFHNGTAVPFSGSGTTNFLGVPTPHSTSIACGDINQDGLPDVLLADSEGRIWEFLNNGSGFSLQSKVWGGSFPGFASGLTLAAVDLEGDGDLDLIGGLANGGLIALRDPGVGRPTGLIAKPGASSIQLEWEPNWQSRIRGYYVYRGSSVEGPFTRIASNFESMPSYLDDLVDPSTQHFYYVTCVSQFFLPGNSTPRISESLSSDYAIAQSGKVALSARPVNGNPGKLVRINLSIENSLGVSGEGMQLRVAYDPTKLTPWAQVQPNGETVLSTGLTSKVTYTNNGATATGELNIIGTGGALEPGSGKFFTLRFKVAPNVTTNTLLGLTLNGVTIFDMNGRSLDIEIAQQDSPQVLDAYFEGDINGDGLLSMTDKDLMQILTKRKSRQPTPEELSAGDINGDALLDYRDLILLLQLLNNK